MASRLDQSFRKVERISALTGTFSERPKPKPSRHVCSHQTVRTVLRDVDRAHDH